LARPLSVDSQRNYVEKQQLMADAKKSKNSARRRLTCVDLFAGAGGFSLAARRAGFTVKLAVENNEHACSTYRHNFGTKDDILRQSDIMDLLPVQLLEQCFGPEQSCDLVLGGPPCQGFSAHRINGAGVKDPRNELIHVYFKFVEAFQPSLFLMENVPGMLWDRHSQYLEQFYRKGKASGYLLFDPVIIDARDHGVPQRRRRVFILGIRRGVDASGLVWPPLPTHVNPSAAKNNKLLKPWVSCSSVFRKLPPDDENNVSMNHSEAVKEAFKRTPPNGGSRKDSGRVLNCHKDHDGHNDVYGRIDPKLPGPTMTTACINPSKGRFVHPRKHHGITVRQAARIQTFPDDYIFKGGLMAAGEQIGNAVPVLLGEKLIRHLAPIAKRARREQQAQGARMPA
jgi:DNA (cytosine-5)-methyltransferase 1